MEHNFRFEKLTVAKLINKLPPFNEQDNSLTCPEERRVHHLILSWTRWIQSTPTLHIYLRFNLILSSHLRLVLPGGLFPLGCRTIFLYAFVTSPIRTTCSVHLILLDLITLIVFGEEAPHYVIFFILLLLLISYQQPDHTDMRHILFLNRGCLFVLY
jgi:hypothetical protein